MWTMDPGNAPELLALLRPHAQRFDLQALWAGEGWRGLVAGCHQELVKRFPDYELLAVKQKYGALAYQAFPRPGAGMWSAEELAELNSITDAAREASTTVCEWCGRIGHLREWRVAEELTLCDDCDQRFPDPPVVRPAVRE